MEGSQTGIVLLHSIHSAIEHRNVIREVSFFSTTTKDDARPNWSIATKTVCCIEIKQHGNYIKVIYHVFHWFIVLINKLFEVLEKQQRVMFMFN